MYIKSCEAPARFNVPVPEVVLVSLTLSLMTSAIETSLYVNLIIAAEVVNAGN
jgi:hypothetical protein